MYYVLTFFVGLVLGAIFLSLYISQWHQKIKQQLKDAEERDRKAQEALAAIKQLERDVTHRETEVAAAQKQVVSYRELQQENLILKRDLQNIDVNFQKLSLDNDALAINQRKLDQKSNDLAKRYLNETVKSVVDSVGPNNFFACKQRLLDVINRCRDIGFKIESNEETRLLAELKAEFEKAVRAQFEREEQARIKAQIREEERLKREIDRELKQLEREKAAIQAALDQALAEAQGRHSAEVDQLKARLAEAEEKAKRALSMAQQTKAGHVYVISNIGSFGEGIFKIGMTRRLQPKERIDELGSASVPFPFDVHMMIHCDDAPSLENALHRALHKQRINKVNVRKEFFKTSIDTIYQVAKDHRADVQYVVDPEALEYRQSITMSETDAAEIAEVVEGIYHDDGDEEPVAS